MAEYIPKYVVVMKYGDAENDFDCIGVYDSYSDALGIVMEDIYKDKEYNHWDTFSFTDPQDLKQAESGKYIKSTYKRQYYEDVIKTYYILTA